MAFQARKPKPSRRCSPDQRKDETGMHASSQNDICVNDPSLHPFPKRRIARNRGRRTNRRSPLCGRQSCPPAEDDSGHTSTHARPCEPHHSAATPSSPESDLDFCESFTLFSFVLRRSDHTKINLFSHEGTKPRREEFDLLSSSCPRVFV